MGIGFLDGQIVREVTGTKIVHAQCYGTASFVLGEPGMIFVDQNGTYRVINYAISSASRGNGILGIALDGISSGTVGPFAVKGKAPLINWGTATSGRLITDMSATGEVLDSATIGSGTLDLNTIGVTYGASGIILW